MPSLSTTPARPVPGRPCKVRPTATSGGTAIRVWCTDAPRDSELRRKLEKSGASRVAIGTFEAGKDFDFTPDKGGGYVLTLDELERGTLGNFRGAYAGDTRGAPTERIIGSAGATIRVCHRLEIELGAGSDKATATIHTHDDRVVATREDLHGIATPAITRTSSARAAAAAETTGVRGALAELAREVPDNENILQPPVVSAIVPDLPVLIKTMAGQLDDHTRRTQSHENVDNDNVLTEDYSLTPVDSPTGQAEALTKLLGALDRHIRNADPGAEENPGTTNSANPRYHAAVGWAALPMASVRPGQTPASIMTAAAEFWRAYEAHRQDTTAHVAADNSNTLGAPIAPLLNLHVLFLAQLAATGPTTPANSNEATTVMLAAGAKEV